MYEKLKALADKKELSKVDKAYILKACQELGVEFNPQAGCKNCYFDQIFVLKAIIQGGKQNEGCDYLLDPYHKVDVIHRGVRINAATLDNEKAEMLIKDGLARWFSIIPKDDNK